MTGFTIADLRREMGLNLSDFAGRIGLTSKSRASEVENGAPCSLRVALNIETLSSGRIDAATLNGDVAAARAGDGGEAGVHAAAVTAAVAAASAGKSGDLTARPQDEREAAKPLKVPAARSVVGMRAEV